MDIKEIVNTIATSALMCVMFLCLYDYYFRYKPEYNITSKTVNYAGVTTMTSDIHYTDKGLMINCRGAK